MQQFWIVNIELTFQFVTEAGKICYALTVGRTNRIFFHNKKIFYRECGSTDRVCICNNRIDCITNLTCNESKA